MASRIWNWLPAGMPSLRAALGGTVFALLIVVYLGDDMHRQAHDRLQRELSSTAFFLSDHAARLFEVTEVSLRRASAAVSGRPWEDLAPAAAIHRQLGDIRGALPYVNDIWAFDAQGRLRLTSHAHPAPATDVSDRDYFRAQLRPGVGLFVGDAVVGRVSGLSTFVVSRRLEEADGGFRGIVSATVDTEYFNDYWARLNLLPGARVSLFRTEDGEILAQHPQPPRGQGFVGNANATLVKELRSAPEKGYLSMGPRGESLVAYHRVGDLPLYLRISVPSSLATALWWAQVKPYALLLILALVTLPILTGLGLSYAAQERRFRDRLTGENARRTADLATLNRTGQSLASAMDVERVSQAVVDAGCSLSRAADGAFLLGPPEPGLPELVVPARAELGTVRDVPEGPEGPLLSDPGSRAPRRCDDLLADPDAAAVAARVFPPSEPPMRSLLAIPVASRSGDLHGALFFGHPDPAHFDADDEGILRGVAAQAAIALDNANLYRSAQREIAARRETEAQQRFLIRELHHRVKNTLATVQSVMSATARSTQDVQEFQDSFTARITSLAGTHTLLTEALWQTASLRELAVKELTPYGEERFSVEGPPVELPSLMAVPIGMALHELATNAAKYGALSVATGHVSVTWETVTREGEPWLTLVWAESGGPLVRRPQRTGFGTRLIDRVLRLQVQAEVSAEYPPTGFILSMQAPISEVQEKRQAA